MTETTNQETKAASDDVQELQEAVELATELSAGAANNTPSSTADNVATATASTEENTGTERAPLSDEERAKRQRERAKRQRERGSEEMKREYAGVMTAKIELTVNDPNVASSSIRFLALTDKTIYLLKRLGPQTMTEEQCNQLMASLQEKLDQYCTEGKQSLEVATNLLGNNRESDFDWIIPTYSAPSLFNEFQVKNRVVIALIHAIKDWDSAIGTLHELEFNAQATASQIDQIRVRERRLFSDINRFCFEIVTGLSRKTNPSA